VDGLVLIDLMKMDRRLLKFYMGAELLERFVAFHEGPATTRTLARGSSTITP